MRYSNTSDHDFVLIFNAGDEFKEQLFEFATNDDVASSWFFAIGAFERATVAYFNLETNSYEEIEITEQVEVVSLIGNLAMHDGERRFHAYVVVTKRDGSSHGGHLVDAVVRPTLELFMTTFDTPLLRRKDAATGLPLIVLDVTE